MDRLNRIWLRLFALVLLTVLTVAPSTVGAVEVTVGPQVRVDAGAGSSWSNETTIASLNGSPMEVVAGWNDYRSANNNGVSVSTDGGVTWADSIFSPPPGASTGFGGDPMACYDDRTGTLWFGGMSWNGDGGVFAARKLPGSTQFEETVMIYNSSGIDKGWMAAGRGPDTADSTYVYLAYNYGSQRSTDMGDNWSNPVSLGSGIGFLPRVGPNGELYVAYWDFYDGVMLRRSLNGGVSFESPIRIATRMDYWDTQGGDRFPGRFRTPALSYLAVDPNNGTLYCLFSDTTGMSGGNRNVDIYLTRSTDQGSNWTTPHVINGDADPAGDQFWSWLEVDQQGRLHTCYLDSRHTVQNDDALHGMFDAYYAISEDGGDTWTEHRLTPDSFDSYDAGGSSQFLGDYMGLAVGGNRVYPCYISTQNGDPDIFTNVITIAGGSEAKLVAGPGPGPDNPPLVRVFPAEAGSVHEVEFTPYGATGYGVNVSCGDVNGDGVDDLLTGAGPGAVYGPHVRGLQADGTQLDGLNFLAYGTNKFGVNVAAGDLDRDGRDEIITGAGPGAVFGPHVRAFDYDASNVVTPMAGVSFFAYGTLKYGVNVACGDIDGDGYDEIVSGAGPGAVFGPHVRGWNVDGGMAVPLAAVSFMAYGTNKWGVTVACGDVDGDGVDEIITAPGPSGLFSAHVRGWDYDGTTLVPITGLSFFAYPQSEASYGARIFASADLNGNGRDEIVVGGGPDPAIGSPVAVFLFDGSTVSQWFSLDAFDSGVSQGATVAAGVF